LIPHSGWIVVGDVRHREVHETHQYGRIAGETVPLAPAGAVYALAGSEKIRLEAAYLAVPYQTPAV